MYSLWKLVILNRLRKGRTRGARAHERQGMFHFPRSALSCQLFGLFKLRSVRDEVHLKYLVDTDHDLAASPRIHIPSHTHTHTQLIHSSYTHPSVHRFSYAARVEIVINFIYLFTICCCSFLCGFSLMPRA